MNGSYSELTPPPANARNGMSPALSPRTSFPPLDSRIPSRVIPSRPSAFPVNEQAELKGRPFDPALAKPSNLHRGHVPSCQGVPSLSGGLFPFKVKTLVCIQRLSLAPTHSLTGASNVDRRGARRWCRPSSVLITKGTRSSLAVMNSPLFQQSDFIQRRAALQRAISRARQIAKFQVTQERGLQGRTPRVPTGRERRLPSTLREEARRAQRLR